MKKNFFLLIALLIVRQLYAQSEYSYIYDIPVREALGNPADPWLGEIYSPPAGVTQIEYVFTSKNSTSTSIHKFNEHGKLTELISRKENGKIHRKILLKYNDKRKIKQVDFYKKDKQDKSYIYEYDSASKITSLTVTDGSGKIRNRFLWEYNDNGCLLKSSNFKRDNKSASFTWEYEYLDSCKKSIVINRNKKGKIVEQWSFMCDEAGKKEKNLQTVCITMAPENDFIIMTNEGTDSKGKTYRSVGKFTLIDTLPLEWKSYNHRNELIREIIYDKDYKIMLSSKTFQKGKPKFERRYNYQNGLLIERSFLRNDKEKSKTTFIYDSNNRLTGTKTFQNTEMRRTLLIKYK